jgi:transposase-like protein
MAKYRPTTPHSNAIIRPQCPKCKNRMDLFGIEAESFGYETQSFSCPKCNHVHAQIGRSEDE